MVDRKESQTEWEYYNSLGQDTAQRPYHYDLFLPANSQFLKVLDPPKIVPSPEQQFNKHIWRASHINNFGNEVSTFKLVVNKQTKKRQVVSNI